MKSWISMIITMAVVSLFAMALISFGYLLQVNNGANGTILDDSSLATFNKTLGTELSGFQTTAGGFKNSSESEQLQEPTGELTLGSIWSAGVQFASFILFLPVALFNLIRIQLGVPVMYLSIVLIIISIIAILAWWRLLKQGE